MGVDPSEIYVKGLTEVTARRNLQTRHRSLAGNADVVNVQLDFALKSANPSQALQLLNVHLADPDAALGSEAATAANNGIACAECVAVQGQQLKPAFGCPAGKILQGSVCKTCPYPQHTTDEQICQDCGANEVPNAAGDGCRCAGDGDGPGADFYGLAQAGPHETTGLLLCYDTGTDWSVGDFAEKISKCQPCGDCLQCENGVAKVRAGFMVSEADKAVGPRSVSTGLVGPLAVFTCPLEGSAENPACNGTQADGTLACGVGYEGALCSVCAAKYSKTGGECIDCSDGAGYASVFVAAAVGVAVIGACVLISCYSSKKEKKDTAGGTAKAVANFVGAGTDGVGDVTNLMVLGKILIGLLQITSELPAALALQFPDAFTAVLGAMKVFLLDVFEVFRIDCITPLSVHAKFVATMAFPLAGIAGVQLLRCIANARAGRGGADDALADTRRAENKATAYSRTFFVIFLLYPLLSRTAFHMTPTACWKVGPDETWHMDDMAIDCDSALHSIFLGLGAFCIVLYPIGIPLTFLFLLVRNDRKSEKRGWCKGWCNRRIYPGEEGEAAASDTDPEAESKKVRQRRKAVIGDEAGNASAATRLDGSAYDFLKKDYKPQFYYFECVTLFEKLLLTGLLVFVDQGGIFQCFVGACIACAFLAVQLKFWPYVEHVSRFFPELEVLYCTTLKVFGLFLV
jgi:hypothetical protein